MNILAGPLVDLSQSVITRLSSGGELALSGILSGQVDRIQAAYDPWIRFDAPTFRPRTAKCGRASAGNGEAARRCEMQCPDCTTAFRVTADVLKQAAGKVRCGGCGHAFNALLYLTETKPSPRPRQPVSESLPELRPEPSEPETREPERPALSAAQSAALLKTLDQLAGEDIRLEDTGVEWRLLGQDEDEANNDDTASADNSLDFSGDGAAAIGVEESDGEVIDFSFNLGPPDTAVADEVAPDQLFADTNAPLDRALFRASTESRVDEILNNAPTPVDELLSASPGDVDAVEVFTDIGATEVEAQDVFAAPETRPEDVLRFDDNTGLPDNFDLDAAASARLFAAPALPVDSTDEPTGLQPDIAFGDPEEWGDLLEEVEPLMRAAPAPERELFADTGMHVPMQNDRPGSAPAAPVLTLAEELAALRDDPDDDVDRTAEVPFDPAAAADVDRTGAAPFDPVAAAGIDLSGIYATTEPPVVADALADAEQYEAEFLLAADDLAQALAADSPFEDFDDLDGNDEAAAEAAFEEPVSVAAKPESAKPAQAPGKSYAAVGTKAFPETTGELEFELEAARIRGADEPEFDPTSTVVPRPTKEEQTVNMQIDADLMRFAIPDDDGKASTIVLEGRPAKRKSAEDNGSDIKLLPDEDGTDSLFETIIMEGGFARTALEQERLAAEAQARARDGAKEAAAQEAARRAALRTRRRRLQFGLIASIVALVLLLAGQFVHQSRAELATIPAVGDAIAPVYNAVGAPITPEWNVRGWRFEVTQGSTDETPASEGELLELNPGEQVLTIRSRLGNRSDTPLPYPLITVALTDRFEEVIGSTVVKPADYLDAGSNASDFVQPGDKFDAVIAVAAPADGAAGFKLNVCYRHDDGQLRCAIEDFL